MLRMNEIEINPQFEHVLNFVNQTNQLVFLTGKAGTGKTTLLKYIRKNTVKQLAIVAPTGVAAINAGGSTIHSFFQFPFSPFLPVLKENKEQDFSKSNLPTLKYSGQRLAIFRKLELLVIDEVSMVRADLLDQIDITLRQTRKKWHLPFGGVQVLLIGDMHQLPPVVQSEEWRLLNSVYASPYFFDSLVIRNNRPVYIELEKIYRQKEQTFIDLLNKVRHQQLSAADFDLLNSHYRPAISKEFMQSSITLTTHNKKADDINAELLAALPDKAFKFKCRVEGSFSEKNYPADEELLLKKGARVMFLKNNTEKNYYNGKIGLVTYISNEKIKVKCEEDHAEIEVGTETWTNVSYALNKQTKGIEEEIMGTFSQFPLRLAWAITIHKSQGLTFDKVIIDATSSFSAGQVYVALSRCRGLEGLTLSSRITAENLFKDRHIDYFSSTKQNDQEVTGIFHTSKTTYIHNLLLALFDFSEAAQSRADLAGLFQAYKTKLNHTATEWSATLFARLDALYQVGQKFKNQLNQLLGPGGNPETDEALQNRVKQASAYFSGELDAVLKLFAALPAFTESKEAADELNQELQSLFDELASKKGQIAACTPGFRLSEFLNAKLKLLAADTKINVYANARNMGAITGVEHPALFRQLLLLRDEICNDEHKPIYMVASNKTLKELVEFLPLTEEQLLNISGFGEAKINAFGNRFLKIIKTFVQENNIDTDLLVSKRPAAKKKKAKKLKEEEGAVAPVQKPKSHEQTFELFKQGFGLEEIARLRGYTVGTLESHLTPYVASGEIDVDRLVPSDKQKMILKALEGFSKEKGLASVKNALPADVSFAQIRYMMAVKENK